VKLWQLDDEDGCSCIAPGETEDEAKQNTRCRFAQTVCDANEIETVTDKDGNAYRPILLPLYKLYEAKLSWGYQSDLMGRSGTNNVFRR
jgi:hypothetical protein